MTEKVIIGVAIFIMVSAIVAVVLYRCYVRRILCNLDRMLDRAISGVFTEDSLDEIMYSAVENKFRRYLADSELSARNVTAEKEKIKTLIADISHQTKTPVANLLLYSELLREQALISWKHFFQITRRMRRQIYIIIAGSSKLMISMIFTGRFWFWVFP